jgi:hypothetical protein
MVGGAAAVRVDEDVRIEGHHALPALPQLEQLVAVGKVDPREKAASTALSRNLYTGRRRAPPPANLWRNAALITSLSGRSCSQTSLLVSFSRSSSSVKVGRISIMMPQPDASAKEAALGRWTPRRR